MAAIKQRPTKWEAKVHVPVNLRASLGGKEYLSDFAGDRPQKRPAGG